MSKTGDIFINAKVHILIDLLFFEITGMQHFETGVTNTLCGRTIQFLLFLFKKRFFGQLCVVLF